MKKKIIILEEKKSEAMRQYLKAKKESSIYKQRLSTLSEMILVELERKVHLEELLEREKRDIEKLNKTKKSILKVVFND